MTEATAARLEQIIALSKKLDTRTCDLIRELAERALADERAPLHPPEPDAIALRKQLDDVDEALGFGYFSSDGTGRIGAIQEVRAQLTGYLDAVNQLVIDANRLCDRELGGTYEHDCRTSLDRVKVARAAYRRL